MHIDPQVTIFAPADILLPAGGIDLTKWAVVALSLIHIYRYR